MKVKKRLNEKYNGPVDHAAEAAVKKAFIMTKRLWEGDAGEYIAQACRESGSRFTVGGVGGDDDIILLFKDYDVAITHDGGQTITWLVNPNSNDMTNDTYHGEKQAAYTNRNMGLATAFEDGDMDKVANSLESYVDQMEKGKIGHLYDARESFNESDDEELSADEKFEQLLSGLKKIVNKYAPPEAEVVDVDKDVEEDYGDHCYNDISYDVHDL